MPARISQSLTATHSSPMTFPQDLVRWQCRRCQRRNFSSTPSQNTRLRREMFRWLNGPGVAFKDPLPNLPNYITAYNSKGQRKEARSNERKTEGSDVGENVPKEALHPFPMNRAFSSQSILSEELRNEIYRRVKKLGEPVRLVSAQLGVEMRRVGAVVRLVEIEQNWRAEGKPLAIPYARAVHEMIPTTPLNRSTPIPHEPINDLPVHAATNPQIFWPTSESRHFNRTDAGRVFSGAHRLPDTKDTSPSTERPKHLEMIGKTGHERPVLLSADARIPHAHLIEHHRDQMNQDLRTNPALIADRYNERIHRETQKAEEIRQKQREVAEKNTKRVGSQRWEFLFKEVRATREGTGLDGRGTQSPGFRYGVPHEDRKRGQHKIPSKVVI